MRIALLSDVHGNLPAFEAVLGDVEDESAEEVWCLGDLVGYGASPDECVQLARDRCDLSLAGNHDLVVTGEIPISDFSSSAAAAARWTQETISEDTMAYLRALSPADPDREPALYHASPRDPVWEYVLSWEAALAAIRDSDFEITIVGHSHVPLAIADDPEQPGGHAPGGTDVHLAGGRWLLNPGSVGQPRDGDPAAAWLLLDLDARRASFLRVPYDVERTQSEIRDVGLPDALAERLAHGV
jgi:predicted phosphodiesterase